MTQNVYLILHCLCAAELGFDFFFFDLLLLLHSKQIAWCSLENRPIEMNIATLQFKEYPITNTCGLVVESLALAVYMWKYPWARW